MEIFPFAIQDENYRSMPTTSAAAKLKPRPTQRGGTINVRTVPSWMPGRVKNPFSAKETNQVQELRISKRDSRGVSFRGRQTEKQTSIFLQQRIARGKCVYVCTYERKRENKRKIERKCIHARYIRVSENPRVYTDAT